MRISKFLAHAGLGARRDCETLVSGKQVSVNNIVITNLATQIDPDKDVVFVYNKKVTLPDEHIYYLINKPSGYLSTTDGSEKRKTILTLLPKDLKTDRRLTIVGRLDKESEGLLLVTDDGETANKLMHPRYEKEKEYLVIVRGEVTNEEIEQLKTGVEILVDEVPYTTLPCKLVLIEADPKRTSFNITLREGKKRQIRLMCEKIGHPVTYLRRIRLGTLELGGLKLGELRSLSETEITSLKKSLA